MADIDYEKVKKISESLADSLASFHGKNLKQGALANRLKKLNPATIAEVLNYFVIKSQENESKFKNTLESLFDISFLVSTLGNCVMSEIYIYLGDKDYHHVRNLLVSYPGRKIRKTEDDAIGYPEMESIPLGSKKSLAKSMKKHLLDKLVYEEHPVVIRNLLNNPRMVERDVLKIATRRPINHEIICEIVNCKKWIDRYIIKKAIIRNPYTPTKIALNLLHFMLIQDLKEIGSDAGLHYSVRDAASTLAAKKKNDED